MRKMTNEDFFNSEKLNETIDELINFMFPTDIVGELSLEKNSKEKLFETYGSEAFLKPEEKKGLVINPKNGEFDCNLIYCARLSAKKEKNESLYEQATNLFLKKNCKARYEVTIEGHKDTYDFLEILDVLK